MIHLDSGVMELALSNTITAAWLTSTFVLAHINHRIVLIQAGNFQAAVADENAIVGNYRGLT
ncbi:MAG: hypothetical protein ACKVK8_04080 [Rhodospirillales bacterium]|jgi:hypothetical protein